MHLAERYCKIMKGDFHAVEESRFRQAGERIRELDGQVTMARGSGLSVVDTPCVVKVSTSILVRLCT